MLLSVNACVRVTRSVHVHSADPDAAQGMGRMVFSGVRGTSMHSNICFRFFFFFFFWAEIQKRKIGENAGPFLSAPESCPDLVTGQQFILFFI